MDFINLADRAVPNPFVDQAIAFKGHTLVAHLSRHARLTSGGGNLARLADCARQRLLA